MKIEAVRKEMSEKLLKGEKLPILRIMDNTYLESPYDILYIPNGILVEFLPDRYDEDEEGNLIYADWEDWLKSLKELGLASILDLIEETVVTI